MTANGATWTCSIVQVNAIHSVAAVAVFGSHTMKRRIVERMSFSNCSTFTGSAHGSMSAQSSIALSAAFFSRFSRTSE